MRMFYAHRRNSRCMRDIMRIDALADVRAHYMRCGLIAGARTYCAHRPASRCMHAYYVYRCICRCMGMLHALRLDSRRTRISYASADWPACACIVCVSADWPLYVHRRHGRCMSDSMRIGVLADIRAHYCAAADSRRTHILCASAC